MKYLLAALLALSLWLNYELWDCYRPWKEGTAGAEHMTEARTIFSYKHEWRMNRKDFYYSVDNAPSLEDAEARVAEIIVTQWGYRFPRWWEMSRWYEDMSPDFRKAVGQVMARGKQAPSKFNGKLNAAVRFGP